MPDEFEYVDLGAVVGTTLNNATHFSKQLAPSRAQRVAAPGDVFYQMVRPYQKNNYLFKEDSVLPTVFSTGYAQLRPEGSSYFLLTLLQLDRFVSMVMDSSTGTSYPAINSNALGKLDIYAPSLSEQIIIGNLFKVLEELIFANQ